MPRLREFTHQEFIKHLAVDLKAVDAQMGRSESEGPTVGESLPAPSVGPLSHGWGDW